MTDKPRPAIDVEAYARADAAWVARAAGYEEARAHHRTLPADAPPGTTTIERMMRGLMRAAEFKEQEHGGVIWDDEIRLAFDTAHALGWGRNQIGSLTPPVTAEPADADPVAKEIVGTEPPLDLEMSDGTTRPADQVPHIVIDPVIGGSPLDTIVEERPRAPSVRAVRPFGGGTHTYALMPVSPTAFDEVLGKLRAAGYDHAIHCDTNQNDSQARLDMHGLALVCYPWPTPTAFTDNRDPGPRSGGLGDDDERRRPDDGGMVAAERAADADPIEDGQ